MKKLFTLFAIALAVVVSSCSKFDDSAIWDKLNEHEETLNDHEKRIAALEELCRQLNTNIDALQTIVEALEKRDYITNVSPVREDGEIVGYTISFANSDTITIYNGKDGVDGKDGYTPQIGVMKDTDGIYYWTIDGEWLLDGKGNKIQANGVNGIDGTDGSNGEDGTNGVDGITPRLKIENDYWYVSYDDGATWIELGKATGEDGADGSDGANGSDGEDGDSIFSSVTQDDEYVYFNLADGTMITLPKHDKENIQFEDLQVKAICCKNWDTNNDGELSYSEAAAVADIGTAFKGNTSIIAFTEFKHFIGLTEIPSNAFYGCTNLWKIELPSITSIGENAFYACKSIAYMNFPQSVEIIGASAFEGCSSLKSIEIPDKVASIEISAFSGCSSLIDLLLGNVITIRDCAFSDCISIKEVIIPNSVTSIGTQAFSGCISMEKMFIPNSVIEFGYFICESCTGELHIECNVPDGKEVNSSYYIFDGVFDGSNFHRVIIGDNVTYIGKYAFNGCGQLESIEFGSNITTIGMYAFLQKTSETTLTSIKIKATVPPALSSNTFDYTWRSQSYNIQYFDIPTNLKIYVPRDFIDDYKTKWSYYSGVIVGYDF